MFFLFILLGWGGGKWRCGLLLFNVDNFLPRDFHGSLRSCIFVPVMLKTLHKSFVHVLELVALKFEQGTQIIA